MESTDERLEALERENAALRHAIVLLHEVSNLLHGSLEVEAACYAVLTGVTAGVGLGFNRAMLFEVDREDANRLVGMMAVGPADEVEADRIWRAIERGQDSLPALYQSGLAARDAQAPLDRHVQALRLDVDDASLLSTALREGRLVEATEADDDLDGLLHLGTGVAAPLKGVNGTLGVLYADNRFTERTCSAEVAQIFALVADHAGRAVENARRFEREAQAARTDALTGLGHHGALMERITGAVADARANEHPLSLVMIDLDNFKGVNDHFGHLAGDELLAALAARLKAHARTGSMAFRYGGEEFTLLLPGVDLVTASTVAERVRRAVADEPFTVGSTQLKVTCSLGVVSLAPGMTVHAFVDAADQALLRAKRSGKNRVVEAA
ncbi:MAG: GGDEF domain-containing protein [Archangium sp.]|nr:GGDEF domain-containing protein [Archangium sp.]